MNIPLHEEFHHEGGAEFTIPWYLSPVRALILAGGGIVGGLCMLGIFVGDPMIVGAMLVILTLALLMLIANVILPWIFDGFRSYQIQKEPGSWQNLAERGKDIDSEVEPFQATVAALHCSGSTRTDRKPAVPS